MNRWLPVVLFFCLAVKGNASNPCCSGDNALKHKRCVDGSNITMSCEKYLVNGKTQVLVVDQNDNLEIVNKTVIPRDRYCVTRFDGSEEPVYLVCFNDTSSEDLRFIIYACLEFTSVFFILLTIVVYAQLPDLLDLQGVCILNSISGLAISFVVLGVNQVVSTRLTPYRCLASAYIIYFCSLYAFFWLNALSFHIWRNVVNPKILNFRKYWQGIYYAYAAGGPTILLIFLIVVRHSSISPISSPGFGETKCWFESNESALIYFYTPVSLLICLNVVFYAWTIANLWKKLVKCDEKKSKVHKYKLKLCVKLFFIMGLPWVFEILSAVFQEVNFVVNTCWILTDCINALQGILIFLVLVVFRKRVIRGLADRTFCGRRMPSKWRTVADDECEDIEEEFGLSETHANKS